MYCIIVQWRRRRPYRGTSLARHAAHEGQVTRIGAGYSLWSSCAHRAPAETDSVRHNPSGRSRGPLARAHIRTPPDTLTPATETHARSILYFFRVRIRSFLSSTRRPGGTARAVQRQTAASAIRFLQTFFFLFIAFISPPFSSIFRSWFHCAKPAVHANALAWRKSVVAFRKPRFFGLPDVPRRVFPFDFFPHDFRVWHVSDMTAFPAGRRQKTCLRRLVSPIPNRTSWYRTTSPRRTRRPVIRKCPR